MSRAIDLINEVTKSTEITIKLTDQKDNIGWKININGKLRTQGDASKDRGLFYKWVIGDLFEDIEKGMMNIFDKNYKMK